MEKYKWPASGRSKPSQIQNEHPKERVSSSAKKRKRSQSHKKLASAASSLIKIEGLRKLQQELLKKGAAYADKIYE
jgi:hypothetical protein